MGYYRRPKQTRRSILWYRSVLSLLNIKALVCSQAPAFYRLILRDDLVKKNRSSKKGFVKMWVSIRVYVWTCTWLRHNKNRHVKFALNTVHLKSSWSSGLRFSWTFSSFAFTLSYIKIIYRNINVYNKRMSAKVEYLWKRSLPVNPRLWKLT